MKLSKNKKQEIEVLKYFIPYWMLPVRITDEDIQDFFNVSERGIKSQRWQEAKNGSGRDEEPNGLVQLIWAKNRRDLQIALWKEDADMYILWPSELKELPTHVYEFMQPRIWPAHVKPEKVKQLMKNLKLLTNGN